MLAAQAQFRQVKGYKQLLRLTAAVDRATPAEPGLLARLSCLTVGSVTKVPTEIQRRAGQPHSPTASDLVCMWASSRSQVPSRRQRTNRS
jgi:hypothetical protein